MAGPGEGTRRQPIPAPRMAPRRHPQHPAPHSPPRLCRTAEVGGGVGGIRRPREPSLAITDANGTLHVGWSDPKSPPLAALRRKVMNVACPKCGSEELTSNPISQFALGIPHLRKLQQAVVVLSCQPCRSSFQFVIQGRNGA